MEWMSASSWDVDLNQRIPWDDEDLFWRKEILWLLGTAQDLEKDRDSGWDIGDTINVEEWRIGLSKVQEKKIKSDSYPHLSDIEREMAIRGTVTELVDVSRTNFNEENWRSHAFPGPTCAMGWMIAWWKKDIRNNGHTYVHLLVEQFRPARIGCSRFSISSAFVSEDSKCETRVYWNFLQKV